MRKPLWWATVLAAGAAACRPAPKLTESQEYFMGRGVAAQAIEKDGLYADPALEEYVTLVGLSVALESDRPETFKGYTFAVLNSEGVNAFAGPSGFIFVTKGALKEMRNEDELAGVLAHEIAHVCLKHPEIAAQAAAEKSGLMKYAEEFQGLAGYGALVAEAFGRSDLARWLELAKEAAPVFGETAQKFYGGLQDGYNRDEEMAADLLAVEFMSRDGVRYDPNAYKSFIGRLPPKPKGAYATHPGLQGRVDEIDKAIRKRGKVPSVDPARTARFQEKVKSLR